MCCSVPLGTEIEVEMDISCWCLCASCIITNESIITVQRGCASSFIRWVCLCVCRAPRRYDTTLYSFAGLMTLSALSNSLIVESSPGAVGVMGGAAFSPHTPLPQKVHRSNKESMRGGKQFTDRRKKNNKLR
mgnify:FL=1